MHIQKMWTLFSEPPPKALNCELIKSWEGLFSLYRYSDIYFALPCPKIASIHAQKIKGQDPVGLEQISIFQRALLLLELRSSLGRPFDNSQDESIVADMVDTLGVMLVEASNSKTREGGLNKADDIKNFFSRAIDGWLKIRFPSRMKHSGSLISKESIAIDYACRLCASRQRLPRKNEIRFLMENTGYGYRLDKSKGVDGKWRDLFTRCGLDQLKD